MSDESESSTHRPDTGTPAPGRCSRCGAPLPAGAAEGSCPLCLLRIGLEEAETSLGEPPTHGVTQRPERIGPYRILEQIGEGGMGIVFLAEQEEPIRRRVALKIIKLGMDTAQVIARFETERQALALMSHPNVARVLDAGATSEGRPYFVMEYVPGIPITEYCDRFQLGLDHRLDLFVQTCDAIQHAHQKGIIHRDIKPRNVLVAAPEGKPSAKVIDFGVAKATTQRLTEKTVFTHHGLLIGTPEYMSPEQAEGGALDVDTRSDVYSLGVLLYELMSGTLPFDPEELRAAGYDEIRRRIREDEPPRPSTRVSSLGAASKAAARNRRTDLASLTRELAGDLDWVVMKALEKDRSRRYASPSELAAEIGRHLRNEPILARPPSLAYRAAKLVRRHRLAATATIAVLFAVIAGAGTATWQALRATRAESIAREEAETARQVADFVIDLFEVSDPAVAQGSNVTALEILEQGRLRIDSELSEQPLIRARLLATMGDIHRKLGSYDEAEPLLEEALAIRERLLGAQHADVGLSLRSLARLRAEAGDEVAAEPLFRRAQTILEASLGAGDPEAASNLADLADVALHRGRYVEAEELHRRALAIRLAALGEEHTEVAASYRGLGGVYYGQGRYAEAEEVIRRGLEIEERVLGENHPALAMSLSNLAAVLGRLGRESEAEKLHLRSLRIHETAYGPQHRLVASSLNNLGGFYGRQGRLAEAQTQFRRAMQIQESIFGRDSIEVTRSYKNLAQVLLLEGVGFEEAEDLLLRSLTIDERGYGPRHFWVGADHHSLARLYLRQGRYDEAQHHLEVARRTLEETVGERHYETLRAIKTQADLAAARGQLRRAEELYRQALATQQELLGEDNPTVAETLTALGALLVDAERANEAEPLLRRALAAQDDQLRPDHPTQVDTLVHLARARVSLGDLGEAEILLHRALDIAEAAHDARHPDVALALHGLADLQARSGNRAAARTTYERALAIRRERLGETHPQTRATTAALAGLDD